MKIYHVYDHEDAAQSDSFWPTKKEASAHIADLVNRGTPRENIVLDPVDVVPTRAGICAALNHLPMR